MINRIFFATLLLAAAPLWSQVASSDAPTAAAPAANSDQRMITPTPVGDQDYSLHFTSEERANYLRGGLTFTGAYSDNVLGGVSSNAVSDVSYSVWPTIELDQSRSRLHWLLSYAPGFTFYQRTTSRNESDQNVGIDLQYLLSPHVTVSLKDTFQRSSNPFNQPNLGFANTVSGATDVPNQSIVAPLSDQLHNLGKAEITYQFSAADMIGASGTFANLHYPNQAQVPGLYDSSSMGGSGFYTRRLSKMHYLGVTYQYQKFLSYVNGGQNETQAHSVDFFYSLYLKPTLSFSLFGGPQYSDTAQLPLPPSRVWSPAAGASMGWQGKRSSLAASYSRTVSGGGGLLGAVHFNSGNLSVRQRLTPSLAAALGASYALTSALAPQTLGNSNGHTISGNASVQRQWGEHFNVQLGYTRLHQSYNNVAAISGAPDTNREWVSFSYQFSRPLGR